MNELIPAVMLMQPVLKVADLEKELRMTRQQEGARGSSSSGAGGRPMSPESSIARLADEVADMKSFCTSAEEQMRGFPFPVARRCLVHLCLTPL